MLSARPALSDEPITIFISYAQEDTLWYGKLEKHLAHERRRGTIISPNFMASDTCITEMEQALQRSQEGSVRLIPIMLTAVAASDWGETDIGQFNPLPEDGASIKRSQDPNDALYKVAMSILPVAKEMRQDPQRERPLGYRSLSVHQAADHLREHARTLNI